ncbi:MAG TPA: cytochrome c oxidase assembly protein [Thiolinea sp.]|nr:cytochrome c oxidase assembly protein [Thiolinea sp.]
MNARKPMGPLVFKLFLVPILMFGFGYLMVPLYDVFCDITGINGKTGDAISTAQARQLEVESTRELKLEFVASVNQDGPWEFHPSQTSMVIRPGKTYTTTYYARNLRDIAATSQAIPSVSPSKAAPHLNKTECFCFTEQKFGPSEKREMPVTFVVDKDVPEDVDTLTLSYTLFTK